MKVSLSWLKVYTSVDNDPEDLAARLTMAGLEVESVQERFDYLDQVVVARVQTVTKHPKADRLSCCQVDVGTEEKKIVCGAPNVKAGMMVACALPGAVLPGGFTIKKSKLRGEVSEGMLCSGTELKLDSDASGIMALDPGLNPGTPLVEALQLSDTVFEIDLTPNRPDCLSILGVARETAAFQEPLVKITPPDVTLPNDPLVSLDINDVTKVEIIDPDLCPRYTAGFLYDVAVSPSPFWLQDRLESVGLTPINNIVDVTNFVMMETGQPLHAFDFDVLSKGRIRVKRAGDEKKFITLDGKEHLLEPDMLMINDGEKPVGIAGVMGGENSEISNATCRVLVESAYFNPISIRKTAKRSGINTDASHRFERGVDPEGCITALKRAVGLMAEISDAKVAKGLIDEYPERIPSVYIRLDSDALNRRLGTDLSDDQIQALLESVAFKVTPETDGLLTVAVPSFRVDVTRPEDLSEEVARLWGYNNIATSFPLVPSLNKSISPKILLRDKIREVMNGFGFSEAVNYSFTSSESCDRLNLAPGDERRSVESIMNPISEELSVLRTSLVPGLLETMRRNISQQTETLKQFEIGNVFYATTKGVQPVEAEKLAGFWTGTRFERSWHSKPVACDFFDLKGVVEGLLQSLGLADSSFLKFDAADYPYFKKGHGAVIEHKGEAVGCLGEISAEVLKTFSMKQALFLFEMDLDILLKQMPDSIVSSPLPRFPSLSRDITIIVDAEVEAGAVFKEMVRLADKEPLMEDVFLFDVYEGEPLAKGKKSFSFRIVYRSWEKTLKEKRVKGLHKQISKLLMETFKADLPS